MVGLRLEVVGLHLLVNRASLLGEVVSTLATGIPHTPKPDEAKPGLGLDPVADRSAHDLGIVHK